MRILAEQVASKIGQSVTLKGWVQSRRDHGGLIFIDLRDHSGLIQLVIHPDQAKAFKTSESLKDEYVIEAKGQVKKRAKDLINPKLKTGEVEVAVNELDILNTAEALPFQLFGSEGLANEELRFKYRFLDLRRPELQAMLKKRAAFYRFVRAFMEGQDFTEVVTPILANSTPEGARDFLVPSRVQPGKFYALPQAPQQFKQLLMVGGVNRYYQIATCFRDEDPRADRLYGDFYQLDIEMSFIETGEEVWTMFDPLITSLVTKFAGKKLLGNQIKRYTYTEIVERYGSDKPDLRFDLPLVNLTADLANSQFGVFKTAIDKKGLVKALRVPGGGRFSRSDIEGFTKLAAAEGAKGLAYLTLDGSQLKSPILKFLSEDEQATIKTKCGLASGDIVFFAADEPRVVNRVLARLRDHFGDLLKLKDPKVISAYWLVDFPFYEWNDKENKLDFGHNPFSLPKGGLKALDNPDKLAIIADQYDLVMNGYECSSGAIRNHRPDIMYKAFGLLGYDKKYVDAKFSGIIKAFKYGAPPHGGCAFGLDRIFMVLTDQDNIREIVAFPKNGSGVDLMMDSPTVVEPAQLKELGI